MRLSHVCMLGWALLQSGCLALQGPDGGHWPCSGDQDCSAQEKCAFTGSANVCMPKDYCQNDQECPQPGACVSGRCVKVQCTPSDATACGDFACDLSKHTCKTSCDNAVDCSSDHSCVKHACVPSECGGSTSAGACHGYGCNYETGLCLSACTASTGCQAGFACNTAGRCLATLATLQRCDVSCPLGMTCNAELKCVAPPAGGCSADTCPYKCCPDLSVANAFQCQDTDDCPRLTDGYACKWDAACTSGHCIESRCGTPGSLAGGATCWADQLCKSKSCIGTTCNLGAAPGTICMAGYECASNDCCSDLRGGTVCATEFGCPGSDGDACQLDSDCISGTCFYKPGVCGSPCFSDTLPCATTNSSGKANHCVDAPYGKTYCSPSCKDASECPSGWVCNNLGSYTACQTH
ncbi:MAG TPA: hypothetical protein VF331_21830 [Polyangiales bacterium]